MSAKHDNIRINVFFVVLSLFTGLIIYRLFVLSYVNHSFYSRTAQAQNENITNVLARGNIYFQDPTSDNQEHWYLAATNKKYPLAVVVPKSISKEQTNEVAQKLSNILGIEKDKILKTIETQQDISKVIMRRLSDEQVTAIKELGIKGVGVTFETDRYYPGNELAANVLGFLGYGSEGRVGQYGVESYYDQELFGKISKSNISANVFNSLVKKDEENQSIQHPADVVLTIDKNIQSYVEAELKSVIEKWSAESGSAIVQDPFTGKILAMTKWPAFNPNDYSDSEPSNYLNSNLQGIYEPGSSFKPVTMAAGLDLRKITPDSTYTDTGSVEIGGFTIRNFNQGSFGVQTMSQVLEKSLNTGTMYVQNLVGDDNFLNYAINMGFGQPTGIDLPGELSGDISNLYSGRKINYLTASFGQGIAVTPLQLINAYSVIANGGKLMKPYIVEKIVGENREEKITQPEIVGLPITEKTAAKVQSMLVDVVDNGFDRARIEGYDIAGKTGTAQIPDGKGDYLENEFIHNFVGFAPAYNAKFVILIKIDKPKGINFAADSLSPTFKNIASFLINYYNIPPTR